MGGEEGRDRLVVHTSKCESALQPAAIMYTSEGREGRRVVEAIIRKATWKSTVATARKKRERRRRRRKKGVLLFTRPIYTHFTAAECKIFFC